MWEWLGGKRAEVLVILDFNNADEVVGDLATRPYGRASCREEVGGDKDGRNPASHRFTMMEG